MHAAPPPFDVAHPGARRVAIVGAGIAGASCARRLAQAGHAVALFDKARGVGGRLSTRRATWADTDGRERVSPFDHGAPGFTAQSSAFRHFTEQALEDCWLSRWTPIMAPGSASHGVPLSLWVPVPDMPSLCRHLLGRLPVHLSTPVAALHRTAEGWRLLGAHGETLGDGYDQVVLALPPAQAAVLLAPHHAAWAERAQRIPMRPCWTLLGVARPAGGAPCWEAARPPHGPLAWVARNETKPWRERPEREVHWVVQATADWSREHLEDAPEHVQRALQRALGQWLGMSVRWRHVAVHRWRYATPESSGTPTAGRCWWDPDQGLGCCGDFLGGSGVEGAWLSAQALADLMTTNAPTGASKEGVWTGPAKSTSHGALMRQAIS